MNALGPGMKSPFVLAILAAVFYSTFSMGALLGAHTALNDSVTYEENREELAAVEGNATADVRESSPDGIVEKGVMSISEAWASGAVTSALWGFDLGYERPTLAEYNGHAAPFIMVGMVAAPLVPLLQKLRGDRK